MTTEFEKSAIDAVVAFYAGDYGPLMDYLDENVIWYGPRSGERIIGKDALLAYYRDNMSAVRFNVSGISTRIVEIGRAHV